MRSNAAHLFCIYMNNLLYRKENIIFAKDEKIGSHIVAICPAVLVLLQFIQESNNLE